MRSIRARLSSAPRCQTGACDSGRNSSTTSPSGCRASRSYHACCSSGASSRARKTGSIEEPEGNAGLTTPSRGHPSAAASPAHQVASEGMAIGSPRSRSQIGGRKPTSAGDSSTRIPKALPTSTPPRTPRFDQPGHAERRIGAQLERIAVVIVEPAQDRVDAPQPGDRLEEHAIVAHGQVGAFDEREPQLLGQVRVLEVGLVEGARRQQHRVRRFAFGRRRFEKRGLQLVDERGRATARRARGRHPETGARSSRGSRARSRRRRAPASGCRPRATRRRVRAR